MKQVKERICERCGQRFTPNRGSRGKRQYCSTCYEIREKEAKQYWREAEQHRKERYLEEVKMFNIGRKIESLRGTACMFRAWASEDDREAESIEKGIKEAEELGVSVIESYCGLGKKNADDTRYFKCAECLSWKKFSDSCYSEKGMICAACYRQQ